MPEREKKEEKKSILYKHFLVFQFVLREEHILSL